MSILSYCFSLKGWMHEQKNILCQDYSAVMQYGIWNIAAVADGVGMCKHSDEASSIAVKSFFKMVHAGFPFGGSDEDIMALINISMHGAANAIESYVKSNNLNIEDYETTLAVALYDGKNVYYGNAGDSGIIALDEYGEYHVLSEKQNNEYGEVITLKARKFEVGKSDFNVAAVFCMTDGLFDWIVPNSLENWKYPVHVYRASLLASPDIWNPDNLEFSIDDYKDNVENALKELVQLSIKNQSTEFFGSLTEGNLKDDLSASVLINNEVYLTKKDIKFELPPAPSKDDLYRREWNKIKSFYPDIARRKFIQFIMQNNASMTEEEAFDYAATFYDDESFKKDKNNTDGEIKENKPVKTEKLQKKIENSEKPDEKITAPDAVKDDNVQNEPNEKKSSPTKKGFFSSLSKMFNLYTEDEDEGENS